MDAFLKKLVSAFVVKILLFFIFDKSCPMYITIIVIFVVKFAYCFYYKFFN